ncbi:MAG: hypothetical protein JJE41_09565 [Candidatus Heimdallarchaeota archaeon]|nr:hypothetical protein [Candidatus Heimdallarchaeota archaeon]
MISPKRKIKRILTVYLLFILIGISVMLTSIVLVTFEHWGGLAYLYFTTPGALITLIAFIPFIQAIQYYQAFISKADISHRNRNSFYLYISLILFIFGFILVVIGSLLQFFTPIILISQWFYSIIIPGTFLLLLSALLFCLFLYNFSRVLKIVEHIY